MEGYKLFRRERLGRSRSVAFSVKEWVDCEGLSLRNSYKQVELVGESQGPHQQRTPRGWGLLQVSDQGQGPLASATGSIVLTSSHPDGGFQPSRYLLEKQCSWL